MSTIGKHTVEMERRFMNIGRGKNGSDIVLQPGQMHEVLVVGNVFPPLNRYDIGMCISVATPLSDEQQIGVYNVHGLVGYVNDRLLPQFLVGDTIVTTNCWRAIE